MTNDNMRTINHTISNSSHNKLKEFTSITEAKRSIEEASFSIPDTDELVNSIEVISESIDELKESFQSIHASFLRTLQERDALLINMYFQFEEVL